MTILKICIVQWSVKESLSNDRGDEGGQKEAKDVTFQGRCGPIASTMDEDMFNLVTRKWQVYVDTSKETSDWFPPTSAGVLFKEMVWVNHASVCLENYICLSFHSKCFRVLLYQLLSIVPGLGRWEVLSFLVLLLHKVLRVIMKRPI
jgi:timeless